MPLGWPETGQGGDTISPGVDPECLGGRATARPWRWAGRVPILRPGAPGGLGVHSHCLCGPWLCSWIIGHQGRSQPLGKPLGASERVAGTPSAAARRGDCSSRQPLPCARRWEEGPSQGGRHGRTLPSRPRPAVEEEGPWAAWETPRRRGHQHQSDQHELAGVGSWAGGGAEPLFWEGMWLPSTPALWGQPTEAGGLRISPHPSRGTLTRPPPKSGVPACLEVPLHRTHLQPPPKHSLI